MVWERWMRSKLSPPDGDRIDPDDEDEDIDELEESDNVRFDCQLAAIGLLSRISLPQCLPNLNKLTQSKLSVIAKCLQERYQTSKDGIALFTKFQYIDLGLNWFKFHTWKFFIIRKKFLLI